MVFFEKMFVGKYVFSSVEGVPYVSSFVDLIRFPFFAIIFSLDLQLSLVQFLS